MRLPASREVGVLGSWRNSYGWLVAFALALFGIKLWLIGAYANATPFWDQWDAEAAFLYQPYLEGRLGWSELLAPHNEHRILTTRLLALFLLEANGSWNPVLQMVVNAAIHAGILVLFVVAVRPALGSGGVLAALVFALALFGVPYAWENTLAGFQSQFYLVLLFSLASLWLLVPAEPLSRRWWAGAMLAILAFFSLASGVFAPAAAAAIGLAFYVLGIRRSARQLVAIGILGALFLAGVALTPNHPGHEGLKAGSLLQFVEALRATLSWPFPPRFLATILRNGPVVVFLAWVLWKRPPAKDALWLLAAFGLWALVQVASLAYGRAAGSLASRYTDLLAIGVFANLLCLIALHAIRPGGWRWIITPLAAVWATAVLAALVWHVGKPLPDVLAQKRATGLAQETNVRQFIVTGDRAHLEGKPPLHVPYPSAERLAGILASPRLREILPAGIAPPLVPSAVEREPPNGFVARGWYSTTPALAGFSQGSFATEGDATTGVAVIRFDGNESAGLVTIPVAGYPLREGIALEIEQDGRRDRLRLRGNPGESWMEAHVRVGAGPFAIVVTDRSPTTWVAVGAPRRAGGLTPFIERLLANHGSFWIVASALAVLLLAGTAWQRLRAADGLLPALNHAKAKSGTTALVIALVVSLLLFGSPAVTRLVVLVAWHALLILIPIAAAIVLALHRGVRDVRLLALVGLTAGGVLSYALFWVWLAHPSLGAVASVSALLIAAVVVARGLRAAGKEAFQSLKPLALLGGVWVLYSLALLAAGLAPSGFDDPLNAVASRFSHPLPMDNQLPLVLAQQLASGKVQTPMIGDWLSSDRPPLQAAYYLASGAPLLTRATLQYQVQSTLLQALWVAGAWLALCGFGPSRLRMSATLLVSMAAAFALVHGLFTWPKLLPVAYLGAVAAVVFHGRPDWLRDARVGLACGAAGALALLSHGSSLFGIVGLAIAALALRRWPSARFLGAALLAGACLMGSWSLYQGLVDPPGNRLVKWHFAGAQAIDGRSVLQAMRDEYGTRTASQIVSEKLDSYSMLVGPAREWLPQMARTMAGTASAAEISRVRDMQFFHFGAALGPLAIALLLLAVPRTWRSHEAPAWRSLLLATAAMLLVWPVALFRPGEAIIHQGSLLMMVFGVAGCVLVLFSASMTIGLLVTAAQLWLVYAAFGRGMPLILDASAGGPVTMASLTALALGAALFTLAGIWRLAGTRALAPGHAIEEEDGGVAGAGAGRKGERHAETR